MFKILICDRIQDPKKFEVVGRVDYKPDITKKEIEKIIKKYDCMVCRTRTKIDRSVLEKAKRLKVIVVASHSLNNIDRGYAKKFV